MHHMMRLRRAGPIYVFIPRSITYDPGGDPSGRPVHGSPSEVVGKLMSDRRVRVAWEAGEKLRKRVGRGKEKGNRGGGKGG